MIFEQLIIHNFGIYKGRHIIDLNSKSERKPIILFGGLNGGGKTTFLDALQLTLYGKFARCSNRGNLSYHDYLGQTINRHISPEEGAALELKFSTYIDGELNTFQVKRYWRSTGKAIKEDMEVTHNQVVDPVMTEQWYEYVNEFLPLSISGLFFFDGEKIEALADPEGSAALIRTGITSLLGLDIVDKLGTDLSALLRAGLKKEKARPNNDDAAAVTEQENKLAELKIRNEGLLQDISSTSSQIDSLNACIKGVRSSYRQAGGDLYDQREVLENNLASIQSDLEQKESSLRKRAEEIAPLGLVRDLLQQTYQQAMAEEEGFETKLLLDKLQQRDTELITYMQQSGTAKQTLDLLKAKLAADIEQRQAKIPDSFYLNIPVSAFDGLTGSAFDEVDSATTKLCNETSELKEKLLNAERQIASIPEGATLQSYQQQIAEYEELLLQEKAKHSIFTDQINKLTNQIDTAEIRLANIKLNSNSNIFEAELQERIGNNIGSVQNILARFHRAMVEKHIKHLESLILESFISLLRKGDLIKKITIDLETFKLTLLDSEMNVIPPSRLSAGERQILAISILWGLAKASGRPLPSIIDTPLGRLDSRHRQQLVNNYFPNASHQLILLSTDQEIDQAYHDDLKEYIGKEYHIQYNESQQTSIITEGYF
ncbi:DNA sulfur modification protein DndD [Amphritea pacifica]|uniref:DNA sulfur modification protein DndD n=1 Tax=Amphritea pacifica TaxID=2811233 RepID=UPI00196557DD|nr:DNA sulfur modification protein DndD [Amphritea pacifica]MBN1006732.1 DNA sulfur modification protein DndD [Amphritea pacifica]